MSRRMKLTASIAISDDEMSDAGGEIAIPLKEKRAKSRSAEYRDDVSEAKSEEDIPIISGDLNGNATKPAKAAKVAAVVADEEDEEGDEDDDLEADEYVVEKILDHVGTVNFRVKWEGYSKKSDQTWEPEDSLKEGASEILEEYLKKLGGREALFEEKTKAKTTKKRGRPSASSSTPPASSKRGKRNGHPAESTPPASVKEAKAKAWTLPSGSWEDDVESIDACEDEESGSIIIYLNWRNGQKTKHPKEVVYKRCPQKMLQFYEKHIRIIKAGPDADPTDLDTAPEAKM
ncbi:chromo domain-containing protein [Colletotrichum abscissum]|uniref:Chromo domain-containing protein n=2 Tax=Colletotrichum acutatum species complex TaxID=2707335 RepID=A0AAJ0DXG9_9PEZI|nr:chromo domain-containing protein [Colletotrichum costaricense]XP_060381988.1 chromo domain-containing protein [Colletotrichum tamarilloi]XP_060403782.1 chromo domain-containing protein [Colletotrichum abscissum]KAK1498498.1 chromo domain-containing protein [Colletotrichum tamarilloi]KAK1514754.1 chromo domain-containing protein [Colletotrichum abscissum]KAK1520489.1 chromo domain-containing protein [Colletotrichum costaricense]